MFAKKLKTLIDSHPDQADSIRRMADFLLSHQCKNKESLPRITLIPNRLFDIMQAGTAENLEILTKILVDVRILMGFFTLRCPSGVGLAFESLSEIPLTVRDPGRDVDVETSDCDIERNFRLVFD